jgi:glycosyltransferase involved in cell wall biosynthesis
MAAYNGAAWIGEQLESIAAQTRPPDELLVSDDGSSDGTREIVERFAARSGLEVRLIDGPGEGLAENFWRAARQARGELVAWADQDDVWEARKLEACERALADADFVSHAAVVVGPGLEPTGRRHPSYGETVRRGPLEGDPWHVPQGFGSVFRRSLLDAVDWERRPVSHQTQRPVNHDHAVSLAAFVRGTRVELADDLARYRQHGQNAAGAPRERGLDLLRVAMRVGEEEFSTLADRARGYGAYAAAVPGAAPQTAAYFADLEERCRRRAALYRAGVGPLRRLGAIGGAARGGVYRARPRGGFGALALGKDVAAVAAGALPAR